MLCPEVWNFKAPESNFCIQKFDNGDNLPFNKLNSLSYNHLVCVVIPEALRVPPSLTQKLSTDCEYYRIFNIGVSDIVSKNFVEGFVRNGKTTLLSCNTRIDCDICVALTSTGNLVIGLDKDSFLSLGLEGKPSHFTEKIKSRYNVTLDLNAKDLQPGKPYHARVCSALKSLPKLDIIISWEPPTKDVCPSSIAKYFSDLGYLVKCCEPKTNSHIIYSAKAPALNLVDFDENELTDFVEWVGMVALEGDLESESGDYVSTYETPEPNNEVGQIRYHQWKGLFTASQITGLLQELRDFNKSDPKPWIALYVQGFSDSPVAWDSDEHHYYTSGDNGYLIILNEKKCILFSKKCSRKRYK